jgi:ubiquitin-conjugating enzyme E2 H
MPEPATEEPLKLNLRIPKDVAELSSRFSVEVLNEQKTDICVDFHGPANSPYEGGLWKVQVSIPPEYPNKPPQLVFKNKILHPNIHESKGTLSEFSSFADLNLVWIFDIFLPKLLCNPDLSNPLNTEAAGMMMRSPKLYFNRVREMFQTIKDPSVLVESAPTPYKRKPKKRTITKLSTVEFLRFKIAARDSPNWMPPYNRVNSMAAQEERLLDKE